MTVSDQFECYSNIHELVSYADLEYISSGKGGGVVAVVLFQEKSDGVRGIFSVILLQSNCYHPLFVLCITSLW